jgi:hypothetical protein
LLTSEHVWLKQIFSPQVAKDDHTYGPIKRVDPSYKRKTRPWHSQNNHMTISCVEAKEKEWKGHMPNLKEFNMAM